MEVGFWIGRILRLPPGASSDRAPGAEDPADSWRSIPEQFRASRAPLPSPWEDIFGPLRRGPGEAAVIGQIGQSLDGRVATNTGQSRYINGPAGLDHLHRLRALVDAVIVGVGSAIADDPQLTVRRVCGPDPARVVIDPRNRLPATARLLADDGARRLVVTADRRRDELAGVEIIALPSSAGNIAPQAILARLGELGLRRVLVEGGPDTILRFLAAGCLDRLHIVVAPVILGGGRASFALEPIDRIEQALRPPMRVHQLDGEILYDCDFSAERARMVETRGQPR